jgi:uncharacterized SAM-binding protein YcdF (DUF218 family)
VSHILKQLAGAMAMPLTLSALIAVSALILRFRARRVAASLLVIAAAVAYLGSLKPTGNLLLRPLEQQYPPLEDTRLSPTIHYIVVLGGDYSPRAGIPVTGSISPDSLPRIVEGIRLLRLLPDARLIASGGAPPGHVAPALGYAQLARELGVKDEALILSDRSLDTSSEARAVVKILGTMPFLLVTSAYHMPRAVWLMRRSGAHPIPAPTGYSAAGANSNVLYSVLPTSSGLMRTEHALHEYAGLLAIAAGLD